MSTPSDAPDPSDIPEFDRVMCGLVGVDLAELREEGASGEEGGKPCPYCGSLMEAGTLVGGKWRFRWAPGDYNWRTTLTLQSVCGSTVEEKLQ
jgi:hypothetical protein